MFSVIIPLYNKELSIKNTIQSVLNQSFENFEIIVVNDGSTDNSLQTVREIADTRIQVVDKPNGGVSSARNRGIEEARYEWITFLDGDDLWKENHLEEFCKAINSDNSLIWLFSGYTSSFDSGSEYQFVYSKRGRLENIFDDLISGIKIHTSTVCIRRRLFEDYPDLYFRLGINTSEDREVWYKLCCIDQSPYYIDQSLSIYTHEDENSLTKNSDLKKNDNFLSLEERMGEFDNFKLLKVENQVKIRDYLYSFNRRAIIGTYVRTGRLQPQFEKYFSTYEWKTLNCTKRFPKIVRKIVSKIC